jgi:hypothetical protein
LDAQDEDETISDHEIRNELDTFVFGVVLLKNSLEIDFNNNLTGPRHCFNQFNLGP